MNIHIRVGETVYGPHSSDEVDQLYKNKQVGLADMIILEDNSEISVGRFLRDRIQRAGSKMISPSSQRIPKAQSQLKQFLVAKGILVRRDRHRIGVTVTDFGGTLTLEALSLTLGNSSGAKKSYGVILEHRNKDDEFLGSDHVDYDEFEEVISALEYISSYADHLIDESIEDTEIKYTTREGMFFGFTQRPGKQLGFVGTGEAQPVASVSLDRFRDFAELFSAAKKYLESVGARAEAPESQTPSQEKVYEPQNDE
jgi:hypothetical protein